MSQELEFALMEERDSAHVLALYQTLYPQLGWTERTLKWQYFENPAGVARVWVGRDGDRVVSTYAAIPHRVYAHGQVSTGWRVQDVLTLPDYRGRGIYNEVSRKASAALFQPAFPLNFTFPNEQSHNGFIRTGWTAAFRLPLRTRADAATLVKRPVAAQVASISRFGERHEDVWREHRSRFRFALDRDVGYLNWRYVDHPKFHYASFELSQGADCAVLVLKHYERADGSRWSHLCDLIQTSDNIALTRSALQQWINYTVEHNCQAMSCWSVGGTGFDRLLNEYSCTATADYTRWCVVNTNAPDAAGAVDEAQWYLAMGDSDVF